MGDCEIKESEDRIQKQVIDLLASGYSAYRGWKAAPTVKTTRGLALKRLPLAGTETRPTRGAGPWANLKFFTLCPMLYALPIRNPKPGTRPKGGSPKDKSHSLMWFKGSYGTLCLPCSLSLTPLTLLCRPIGSTEPRSSCGPRTSR